jgi:preprotein translocase subunit SecA
MAGRLTVYFTPKNLGRKHYAANEEDYYTEGNQEAVKRTPASAEPKIGRNDPCPCGSGKKYKSCHGQGL